MKRLLSHPLIGHCCEKQMKQRLSVSSTYSYLLRLRPLVCLCGSLFSLSRSKQACFPLSRLSFGVAAGKTLPPSLLAAAAAGFDIYRGEVSLDETAN